MKKLDLSIIILVYNARGYLANCIKSIEESNLKGISYEIIIVDNVSEDGSIEEIEEIAKTAGNTKTIFNKENLGFAKGNNVGVEKSEGEYVLFLNPDTVLSKDALQTTLKFMQDNLQVGAAGGHLVLANGDLDSAAHRGFPTPWRALSHFTGLRSVFPSSKMFAGYTPGWQIGNKSPHEVDSISGAFFFTRRTVGEKLGWWDETFFMYGEDVELGNYINKFPGSIAHVAEASVIHEGAASSGIATLFYESRVVAGHIIIARKLALNSIDHFLLVSARVVVLFLRAFMRALRFRSIVPISALFEGCIIAVGRDPMRR
jgi:GT2 family glycosyltransferase